MPGEKSSPTFVDWVKALGGISVIGVLREFLDEIVKGFLGLEGVSGRITSFWMVFCLIGIILWALDYLKDKKISKASVIGISLTFIGAVWGTAWSLHAPLPATPTPTITITAPTISPSPDVPTLGPSPTTTPSPLASPSETSTLVPTNTPNLTPTPTPLGGGSGQLVFSALKGNTFNDCEIHNCEIYLLSLGTSVESIDVKDIINLSDNLAPDENPDWSPDGTHIVFISRRDGNPEIYVMDADGQNQVNITQHNDRDYQPAWSPDGTYIAFGSYRGPGANQDIFIMNNDGSDVRQITSTGRYYRDPDWSADGDEIFFIAMKNDAQTQSEIYAYNLLTKELRQITRLDKLTYAPNASPDGKWLVFTSSYSGFQNLFRIDTNGYNLKQLTDQIQAQYHDPVWSPDGQWIAFVIEGKDENTLALYSVASKEVYKVLSMPGLNHPAWRPQP